jgi:hypothetical protein
MTRVISTTTIPYSLLRAVTDWEPPKTPHCSNCRHAIVKGPDTAPVAECAQGWGKGPIDLFRLIRPKNPRGFRAAGDCPDFDSMSDDEGEL